MNRTCSWCTEEDGDIELATEIDKKQVLFFLGADCFYRVVMKALGNPRRMVIAQTKKKEKKEHKIVN
jgi:hypothetical protein